MLLSDDDKALIQNACKNEESYHAVIALFNQHNEYQEPIDNPPQTDNSKALYQSLIDTLPMNVYRIDRYGKLTFGNQFLLKNLNLSEDDFLGKTAYDFYPEEDAQKYRHDDETVIKTGEILHTIEENISPVNEVLNYVETFKIPIYDESGKIEGIQGIFWDITERKQAEDAIRISENRAKALLAAIPDAVFHLNREGQIIDYIGDESDLSITSISPIVGSHIRDIFPSDSLGLFEQNIRDALATNQTVTIEFDMTSIDNNKLEYETRIVKVNENEVIAIVQDITQRNKIMQQELDFKLEKERGKMLTKFIQSASHEFRTPLATIITSIYLLTNEDNSQNIKNKLEQIENQANRLSHLVDMQLMIVRLNHLTHLSISPININNLLNTLQQDLINKYGMLPKISIELPEDILICFGDEGYLLDGLLHILDNAYNFTPQEGYIEVGVTKSENTIHIDIQDSGTGISKEAFPHIFEMFWRKDQAHSTPGFGLGLSITKKIIELHRGEINITSDGKQGTHVHISLPAKLE